MTNTQCLNIRTHVYHKVLASLGYILTQTQKDGTSKCQWNWSCSRQMVML